MKKVLRSFVLFCLKRMAKRKLRKFKGKVIAVTGSVGKTSTKDAIYTVLNTQFRVRQSKKSMNSEFGLLLTILDIESGFSSAVKWSWLLMKAFWNTIHEDLTEVLLLELGVDKPGDMDFLMSVVRPDIAVVTNIYPVHIGEGQFTDTNGIFEEKIKMVKGLKDGGKAILNTDSEHLAKFYNKKMRSAETFGANAEAKWRVGHAKVELDGTRFSLHHNDVRYAVEVPALGDIQGFVATPAVIVGTLMGMEIEVAVEALKRYVLPPGRMTVIEGKEGCTILDSSYNSSPAALKGALGVLREVAGEKNRRVAVLGSMNELGERSRELHEEIGAMMPRYADLLITVGEEAQALAEMAVKRGLDKRNVHSFRSAEGAAKFYLEQVKGHHIVLVKGSQNNVRLERFVKELMARPEDAPKLLVRQEREWMRR